MKTVGLFHFLKLTLLPKGKHILYSVLLACTGIGTKFVAYQCPSPTLFEHEMYTYWSIMQNKVRNDEYSLYSTQILIIFQLQCCPLTLLTDFVPVPVWLFCYSIIMNVSDCWSYIAWSNFAVTSDTDHVVRLEAVSPGRSTISITDDRNLTTL